jgi:hypothetical protein
MMADELEPQSPEWWIARLWRDIDDRARRISLYDDYYEGRHRLMFTTQKAREVFGDTFRGAAVNFCSLVVDAIEERLSIRGFRVADAPDLDPDAMTIWEKNDMDVQASMVHTEALCNEEGYLIVWLDPDRARAIITAESPFEVYVERSSTAPGQRAAAIKRWIDAEHWRVTLYLPDATYRYVSKEAIKNDAADVAKKMSKPGFWEPFDDGQTWPLPNPLGIVPVVPVTNRPRLGPSRSGTSELKPAVPIQDIINKTAFDELIASEFVAYPQRYMVGVAQPVDENDQPVSPFKAGVDRMWFIEVDGTQTIAPSVGQFTPADMRPYVERIDAYVGRLASVTMTPKHYLIEAGGGTNLSGETIKALEAPLVSKARRRMGVFGVSWAEVMALALRLEAGGAYDPDMAQAIEVDWKDPETRTEAQHVDALLKMKSLGVPDDQLQRDYGYTEDQIRRFAAAAPEPPEAPGPPAPGGDVPPAPPVPGNGVPAVPV